jgi:hypothetical protein
VPENHSESHSHFACARVSIDGNFVGFDVRSDNSENAAWHVRRNPYELLGCAQAYGVGMSDEYLGQPMAHLDFSKEVVLPETIRAQVAEALDYAAAFRHEALPRRHAA